MNVFRFLLNKKNTTRLACKHNKIKHTSDVISVNIHVFDANLAL